MKKRIRKLTAVMLTLSMLLSGCGSLFMDTDMTVSLSSQGTEGVDEMLNQGMEEEFKVEIYEEDRWSSEITSTAKAFYIDPLANDTMVSFELIHHDEESHVLLYAYQALKKDPNKVSAYDAYYVYVQQNRDASDAYVAARDTYELKSAEESTANAAFQDILAKITLSEQTYLNYQKELEEANALYAQKKISKTELDELTESFTKAKQELDAYTEQKIELGKILSEAQTAKENARKQYEAASEAYQKTQDAVKKAEQDYRKIVGNNSSGFSEAQMDTNAEENKSSSSNTSKIEASAGTVGGNGSPTAPGKLSTGTSGEEKTLLEAVMERNSSRDLLYRAEENASLTLLADSSSGTNYVPGANSDPMRADDISDDDKEALENLKDLEEQMKPPEDVYYDSTDGVNGGDELLQDPQVMLCEVVMYDYINKRYSSVFKTEAEPNEEKMLYVNLLGDNQIAVFFKGIMMYYVQDSVTGGYRQLWKYDMSSYYEPLVKEKVPNLDEWTVENVLSLSGGQDNYLVIRATEKESEDIADDDDAVAEDLENRTHYLLVRLMASTIRDTKNYFMQYGDGNVYYYGFVDSGEPAITVGYNRRNWWAGIFGAKSFKDVLTQRTLSSFISIDITSASNWGEDPALANLYSQSLSTDRVDQVRAVRSAIVSSSVPLDFTGAARYRTIIGNKSFSSVPFLERFSGYLVGGKYYYQDNKVLALLEGGKSLAAANTLLGTDINVHPIRNAVLDEVEKEAIVDKSGVVKTIGTLDALGTYPKGSLMMTTGEVSAEQQKPDKTYYFPQSSEHSLERGQYLKIVDKIASLSDYEKALLYSVYVLQYYPNKINNHTTVLKNFFSGSTEYSPKNLTLEDLLAFLEICDEKGSGIVSISDWADAGKWESCFGKGEESDHNELNGKEFGMGDLDLGENRETALKNIASKLEKSGGYKIKRTYSSYEIIDYENVTINLPVTVPGSGNSTMTISMPIYGYVPRTDDQSGYYIATGMDIVNRWVNSLKEALLVDYGWEPLKLWSVESGAVFHYEAEELSAMAGTTLISAKVIEDDYILLPMDNKSLATLDYYALVDAGGSLLSCAANDFRGATSSKNSTFLQGIAYHTAPFDKEDEKKKIVHEYADEREFVDGKWQENDDQIINFMLGKDYLRVNRWLDWFSDELPIFTQNLSFSLISKLKMARMPIAELEVGIRCGEEAAGSMAQTPGQSGSVNPSDFGAETGSQLIPNAWSLHMLDEEAVWKYKENGEEKTTSAFTILIAGQSYGLIQATSPWNSYTDEDFEDEVYAEQLLPGCYYLLLPSEDPDTFYLIGYDDVTKTYKPSDIAGAGIFKITIANEK